jgi:hypothetical protein
MNQFSAPASTTRPSIIAAKEDAFERLTFLGWRTGLTAIVAGLAASFFLFGYALIYWRNADMDLMVVYNALVLNDGKPQLFFDHTAYLTILSLKLWFRLLHALGLLDAYSLSAIPPASNAAAFDAAMTGAVRAGRVLAWLIATSCVLIFAALVRRIVRDWRIALLATFAFAFSGGIAVHSRILRSELVAACPVIFALMILMVVGRSLQHRAAAMDGSRRRIMRSWSGEQGAGNFADWCAAAAVVAVRQPEERKRCVLAQSTIKLVRSRYCGRRSDCLGIGGVAADISRL